MVNRTSTIRIGCSGWNYKSWAGRFYPAGLPPSRWLDYYAKHFDTVELNNSFYRLPERSTFAGWGRQVPGEFVFAVKASRYLTHMKRLREPEEPLIRLFSRATALGVHLGPALYQLPATLTVDLLRLSEFLDALPRSSESRRMRHVMEFRHPSWYIPGTFRLLDRHGIVLCLHDKHGSEIEEPIVGPFMYLRFHGTSGRYHGSYSGRALDRWASRIARRRDEGRDVYAYFNNDPDATAVRNAMTLRGRVERAS